MTKYLHTVKNKVTPQKLMTKRKRVTVVEKLSKYDFNQRITVHMTNIGTNSPDVPFDVMH